MDTEAPAEERPTRYIVDLDREDRRVLPKGTNLEGVRRFERFDNSSCVGSFRELVAELRVLNGNRAGELIEVTVESGYDDGPPIWSGLPDWLAVAEPEPVENGR